MNKHGNVAGVYVKSYTTAAMKSTNSRSGQHWICVETFAKLCSMCGNETMKKRTPSYESALNSTTTCTTLMTATYRKHSASEPWISTSHSAIASCDNVVASPRRPILSYVPVGPWPKCSLASGKTGGRAKQPMRSCSAPPSKPVGNFVIFSEKVGHKYALSAALPGPAKPHSPSPLIK